MLEPMTQEAYAEFRTISFQDHAEELIQKEHLPREEAEQETRRELAQMLPLGLETKDNYLFTVWVQGTSVGYLWFLTEVQEGIRQAFLCDFQIAEPFRRRGYGRAALMEMEDRAKVLGCRESVLFVESENTAARNLYAACGYQILREHSYGYFLKKELAAEQAGKKRPADFTVES